MDIDFADPYFNQMVFFLIVDVHSKWPEVILMNRASNTNVINALCLLFFQHGKFCQIVSDNGSQFISK